MAVTYLISSGSHCSDLIFISIVLLALVTSVANTPPSSPPVRFYNKKYITSDFTSLNSVSNSVS
mgnify:FL=1